MSSNLGVVVAQKLGTNVNPLEIVQTLVEYADHWVTEIQRANIERDTIATWEHVQIEKIDAQRAILLKALDLTFDERRENFRRLFDGLDSAMGSGNAAQAAAYLESITDLAKVSPFTELANLEIIVTELKRPDQVWDV